MQIKIKAKANQQQNGRQHTSELTTIVKLCAAHKVVPALSSTVFLRRTRLSPRRLLKIAFVPKYQVVVDRCNVNWRPPSSWTTFSVPAGLAVTLLPRLGPSNNGLFRQAARVQSNDAGGGDCKALSTSERGMRHVRSKPSHTACDQTSCEVAFVPQAEPSPAQQTQTLTVSHLETKRCVFRRQSHLLLSKRKP